MSPAPRTRIQRNRHGKILLMYFSILLIAIARAAVAEGAGLTAEGSLEPREIPFHHVARYRVVVEGPAGAEISLAPWEEAPPGLEVRPEEPERMAAGSGRQRVILTWQLTPAHPSQYTLPPVVVLTDGAPAATLEPGALTVRSLTPEEEAAAREMEGLVTLADLRHEGGRGIAWGAALAAGGVLVVGAALWWFRGRFGLGRARPERPIAVALAQLDELADAVARGTATCEAVYVGIDAALRGYLEHGYGLQVAELATPEIVAGPLEQLPADTGLKEALQDLLTEADRVKFAGAERDVDQQQAALSAARSVLSELDAPAVPEAALPGAA